MLCCYSCVNRDADLAQLAEHLSCKQGVGGSNPLVGINLNKYAEVVQW
jgi:hypothetical protein